MSDLPPADELVSIDQQQAIDNQPTTTTRLDSEQQRAVSDYSKANSGKLSMQVQVYSPFQDYYEGLAFSLTAENATGPFDVLPKHHNFISLLMPCELIIRTVKEGERKIQISGGIIHVKANKITVFLDV